MHFGIAECIYIHDKFAQICIPDDMSDRFEALAEASNLKKKCCMRANPLNIQ